MQARGVSKEMLDQAEQAPGQIGDSHQMRNNDRSFEGHQDCMEYCIDIVQSWLFFDE